MNESQAFAIIRAELLKALKAYGHSKTQVLAGRQPVKQMLVDNSIYMFAINEESLGVQSRRYRPDINTRDAGHAERAVVLKTIQVQAFKKEVSQKSPGATATDLCALVRMVFNSLPFQEAIISQGVSTHNTTQIREPEFVNDAGDYEKQPSFDVTMVFERTIKPITPAIEGVVDKIKGV